MLQAALNRFRARLSSSPLGVEARPHAVPNIGVGSVVGAVVRSVGHEVASPEPAIIGSSEPQATHLALSPTTTVVPIIGTKHGRGYEYAEAFAARFLAWLTDRPEAATMLPDEVITDIAANRFAPAVGMAMPPTRNLLTALKRSPGVRVKRDVRVRDHRGDVIGKTTMYLVANAAQPPRLAA